MKITRNKHKQVFDVFLSCTDIRIIIILCLAAIIVALSVYNIEVKQKKSVAPTTEIKHNINS